MWWWELWPSERIWPSQRRCGSRRPSVSRRKTRRSPNWSRSWDWDEWQTPRWGRREHQKIINTSIETPDSNVWNYWFNKKHFTWDFCLFRWALSWSVGSQAERGRGPTLAWSWSSTRPSFSWTNPPPDWTPAPPTLCCCCWRGEHFTFLPADTTPESASNSALTYI